MAESSNRRATQAGAETPDQRLVDALAPTIQHALRRSLRDDRKAWAEALYPIILPTIRMAVASAFREAVDSLNQALETGLSARAWKWRVEAWRTRKPFAEIVLLRTLIYRVEQVLLVHRSSGLLLDCISTLSVSPKDPDLVSSMLVAVQEFIRDSLQSRQGSGLQEVRMTDVTLWVEQGPWAAIAVVIRGQPPAHLRQTLRAAVDLVHQEMAPELREFDGDTDGFARAHPILEGCLQAGYQKPERQSYRTLAVTFAVLLILGLIIAGFIVRERVIWSQFIAKLGQQKGLVVTSHDRPRIEGLRDPMSADPAEVAHSMGIDPARLTFHLRPFISLEPEFVLMRATQALRPPATTSLRLAGNTLVAEGTASQEWIRSLETANLAAFGIREIRTAGLRNSDLEELEQRIESQEIRFDQGSSRLTGRGIDQVRNLADMISEWMSMRSTAARSARIQVIGRTDRHGTVPVNLSLSSARARWVKDVLVDEGIPADSIETVGEGHAAAQNAAPGANDAYFRCVRIRLIRPAS